MKGCGLRRPAPLERVCARTVMCVRGGGGGRPGEQTNAPPTSQLVVVTRQDLFQLAYSCCNRLNFRDGVQTLKAGSAESFVSCSVGQTWQVIRLYCASRCFFTQCLPI